VKDKLVKKVVDDGNLTYFMYAVFYFIIISTLFSWSGQQDMSRSALFRRNMIIISWKCEQILIKNLSRKNEHTIFVAQTFFLPIKK
jgi:hypothetical protein